MYIPCHVVTPLLQFNESPTAKTLLPTIFLCLLQDLSGLFIPGAFSRLVPLSIASAADFGVTPATFGIFAAISLMNSFWFNPHTAAFLWAVDAIPSRILGKFSIPVLLELGTEQIAD